MAYPTRLFVVVLLLTTAGPAIAAPPVNERAMHEQIVGAERAINGHFRNLRNLTGSMPMSLMGVTRGGYVAGFGAVFSLEISLLPVSNLGPFRQPTEEEKSKLNLRKRQRLEDLEIRARTILVKEGPALSQIPPIEKVALIISIFHHSWEDVSGLPSQLVMQAQRQLLIDHQAGRVDLPTLKEKLELAYF